MQVPVWLPFQSQLNADNGAAFVKILKLAIDQLHPPPHIFKPVAEKFIARIIRKPGSVIFYPDHQFVACCFNF